MWRRRCYSFNMNAGTAMEPPARKAAAPTVRSMSRTVATAPAIGIKASTFSLNGRRWRGGAARLASPSGAGLSAGGAMSSVESASGAVVAAGSPAGAGELEAAGASGACAAAGSAAGAGELSCACADCASRACSRSISASFASRTAGVSTLIAIGCGWATADTTGVTQNIADDRRTHRLHYRRRRVRHGATIARRDVLV